MIYSYSYTCKYVRNIVEMSIFIAFNRYSFHSYDIYQFLMDTRVADHRTRALINHSHDSSNIYKWQIFAMYISRGKLA